MAEPQPRRPLVAFLTLDQRFEVAIRKILREAANDLERDILAAAASGADPLPRIQLQAQRAAIAARLNQDWSSIARAIASGRLAAADVAGRIATDMSRPILSKFLPADAIQAMAASEAARAANGVEAVMARLTSSYIPLSDRVYRNAALTTGRVDRLVNSALVRGVSARTFAQEVRRFVSPDAPGGMSYSAMRLARTELNNAFHATSVDRYMTNELVGAVDWNLSRSHKVRDVCDDLAAEQYKPDAVPQKPHPQCFCYITPGLIAEPVLERKLYSGGFDTLPWWNVAVGVGAAVILQRVAARGEQRTLEAFKAEVSRSRIPAGESVNARDDQYILQSGTRLQ